MLVAMQYEVSMCYLLHVPVLSVVVSVYVSGVKRLGIGMAVPTLELDTLTY